MPNSSLYPLFLNLTNRPVLIVGGGPVAARKAAALLEARAKITLISPDFHPTLANLPGITRRRASYSSADMTRKPWRLVFAATNLRTVNAKVNKDARKAGIFCCRCDNPDAGDFINGATARLRNITLAISTGGASPGVATRLRQQALAGLDPLLAELIDLHAKWRDIIKQQIPKITDRAQLFRQLAGAEMEAELRRAGRPPRKNSSPAGSPHSTGPPTRVAKRQTPLNNIQPLQFALFLLTTLLFAAAFIFGLRHMRRTAGFNGIAPLSIGPASRAAILIATIFDALLLAWRAAAEQKLSLPLSDHFDAFLVMALLLAAMLIYLRWTKNLRGLSFFLLPMIVILLALGGALSILTPSTYPYGGIWMRLHITTVIAGTVCFALGCVGGAVYLLAHRQLKNKMGATAGNVDASHRWSGLPPLGSIEKFNQLMVYLGFPLLTIAMVTGILRLAQEPAILHTAGLLWKICLAALAWAVYAVLAHLPLTPRFRGPRAAWLWIIGFALFIGGYVAANWAHGTGGGAT